MKTRSRKWRLWMVPFSAVLLAAQESPPPSAPASQAAPAASVVHVDPASGRNAAVPADEMARLLAQGELGLRTSAEGLTERAAPGGGVMVNLDGRFASVMGAAVDEHGDLHTDCGHEPAPGAQREER